MTESIDHVITMQNVCKRYPGFSMMNLNLALPRGEIMGIIGPNGAGKSTTLQMIMGFVSAESGYITVLGKDITCQAVDIKKQVAYVAEDMRLFGSRPLEWHMRLIENIFPSWDQNYADHLLKVFDLDKSKPAKALSLGQRIKSTLLLALARRPKILILDEPSTGLDPVARHELTSELFELMLNEEHSVIFSSQHTQDVERLSDTIAFMDNGEFISLEDKESYLEKWRKVEIVPHSDYTVPVLEDVISIERFSHTVIATHSNYSASVLSQYINHGLSVKAVNTMNLEEIFISQVMGRRNSKV